MSTRKPKPFKSSREYFFDLTVSISAPLADLFTEVLKFRSGGVTLRSGRAYRTNSGALLQVIMMYSTPRHTDLFTKRMLADTKRISGRVPTALIENIYKHVVDKMPTASRNRSIVIEEAIARWIFHKGAAFGLTTAAIETATGYSSPTRTPAGLHPDFVRDAAMGANAGTFWATIDARNQRELQHAIEAISENKVLLSTEVVKAEAQLAHELPSSPAERLVARMTLLRGKPWYRGDQPPLALPWPSHRRDE